VTMRKGLVWWGGLVASLLALFAVLLASHVQAPNGITYTYDSTPTLVSSDRSAAAGLATTSRLPSSGPEDSNGVVQASAPLSPQRLAANSVARAPRVLRVGDVKLPGVPKGVAGTPEVLLLRPVEVLSMRFLVARLGWTRGWRVCGSWIR